MNGMELHPRSAGCGNKKKGSGSCLVDRISELDDNLKAEILERLPLTDAIRTSELSRKWRSAWTRMGRLDFDESVWTSMGKANETRFTRIIDKVLVAHQGPLKQFFVYIPKHIKLRLFVNGWFINLARKNVQEVEIWCDHNSNSLYSVPSNFFACGGLTYLCLGICTLKLLPNFQGFPNLVSCYLDRIDVSSNELADFIYRCPRIETLSLAEMAKYFSEPLHINAPNLRTLYFEDYISGMINLKNTPWLTDVSLKLLDDKDVIHKGAYSSFQLLSTLSRIKELTFDLPLLEPFDGERPNNLGTEFVALKTLSLGQVNLCRSTDISFMFCLIRSAPNLKTLSISVSNPETNYMETVNCLKAEVNKGCKLSQLVEVTIDGVAGLKVETMLVKLMLHRCPLLKTLYVKARKNIANGPEKKMAWKLNSCRRLSRDVKLVYLEGK